MPKRALQLSIAATLALTTFTVTGTAFAPPSYAAESIAPTCDAGDPPDTVIVLALDGVRWQDVFEGTDPALAAAAGMTADEHRTADELVPHLHALARRGVALGAPGHGAPLYASGPNFVSLPGYTELFTGRPAPCQENDCTARPPRTLVDDFAARPGGAAVITSWEPIGLVAAGDPSHARISAGRTAGETRAAFGTDETMRMLLEAGARSTPAPGHGSYRPDALTSATALAHLGRERPALLFVGLGDTDEHAHAGDYRAYLASLSRADRTLGDIVALTAAWARDGHRTTLVVTTDHGRSHDFRDHGRDHPESSRVWLVAAGAGIPALGLVASPQARYLRDVAPSLRALAGLPPDADEGAGVTIDELFPRCAPARADAPPRREALRRAASRER